MKKSYIKITLIICFIAFGALKLDAATCRTGGPGSTGCTYGYTFLWGLIGETYTVSCGDCQYACCTKSDGKCITRYSDDPNNKCHPENIDIPGVGGPGLIVDKT
ncbi:MAG: hypothetical protein ACJAVN_002069 [Roseivirga sp.]|jgi:hypothetical protein